MKTSINKTLLILFLSFMINNGKGQVFFENFENLNSGVYQCSDPGRAIYNGALPNWTSYNYNPTLMNTSCPSNYSFICSGNNINFQAYSGTKAIAIGPNYFLTNQLNGICSDQRKIGLGVCYSDKSNPSGLYFGREQPYLVKFKAKNVGFQFNTFPPPYYLQVGYKENGQEIPNNYNMEPANFNFIDNFSNSNYPGGKVPINGTNWNNYTAQVINFHPEKAYQLVMACNGDYCFGGQRPIYFIDDIQIDCDPMLIFVEIKELIGDTINELNCSISKKYRIGAKYNCPVDFSKLRYMVEVYDKDNHLIQSFENTGEFFTVYTNIFEKYPLKIKVTSILNANPPNYDFVTFYGNEPGQYYDYEIKTLSNFLENNGEVITIQNGQDITWDGGVKYINKEIFVQSGGKLTIKNKLIFNGDIGLYVDKGGKLIIDGGYLTTCKTSWKGIVIHGNNLVPQTNTAEHAYVETKNNAVIEKAERGIGNREYDVYNGGIVKCRNTTFKHCKNGVYLRKYDFLNESLIENCNFINGETGIYFYGIRGTHIWTSSFSNLQYGISTIDSKYEVLYSNVFNNISEAAIYSDASAPNLAGIVVRDNQFWNLPNEGISIGGNTGNEFHNISDNYFDNCWFSVEFYGDNYYNVSTNTFNNCGYGVISNATNEESNDIRCNEMIRTKYGNVYALYKNSRTKFMGNNFIESGSGPYKFDFRLYEGSIDPYQGSEAQPAFNYFWSSDDIETENGETFTYFTPNPDVPRTNPQNPGNYIAQKSNPNQYQNDKCSTYPEVPYVSDVDIKKLKEYYCYWYYRYKSDPTNTEIKKKFLEVSSQFHLYLYYWSIQNNQGLSWEKIKELLKTMCGQKWLMRLYGLYLEHGDIVGAEAVLNELDDPRIYEPPVIPDDLSDDRRASFITTQRINLKYLKSNGTYQFTVSDINTLLNETNKNIPERAYSRGLYYHATGTLIRTVIPEERTIQERGIAKSNSEQMWKISPNPVSDKLNFDYQGTEKIETSIMIYNVDGMLMNSSKLRFQNLAENKVDVESLADGIYMVIIKDQDNTILYKEKFVKIK